jgi:hypothetical protein
MVLAFGTVTVLAGVIAVAGLVALIAVVDLTAKLRSAAGFDVPHGSKM